MLSNQVILKLVMSKLEHATPWLDKLLLNKISKQLNLGSLSAYLRLAQLINKANLNAFLKIVKVFKLNLSNPPLSLS